MWSVVASINNDASVGIFERYVYRFQAELAAFSNAHPSAVLISRSISSNRVVLVGVVTLYLLAMFRAFAAPRTTTARRVQQSSKNKSE
mmetsp:Transcript_16088/g.34871  ORF Transcript_16088/g.34871 Transcript_16088/m.34871 type:complete len:88 (-) Transcript_16088:1089-1352(-)